MSSGAGAGEPSVAVDAPTFEQHIRPILKANCFHCHGEGEKLKGDLDLRLRRLIVKGGEHGAAVAPGDADNSLLYQLIRDGKMPRGGKALKAEEIALIRRWVQTGAGTLHDEPATIDASHYITEEERAFWSFQPIRRPVPPTVRSADRVHNAIDAFVLKALEDQELTLAPEADRRTLIRRATYDLHGLPPTPQEVDAFVQDTSPRAYEKLIDRLLASPRYGERWGRHWLDVAGYADSEGYTDADPIRPYAYKYRDYVIRAFNADKPFDQFIVEQLAGDELITPPYVNLADDAIEKLTATGFLRMAPDGTGAAGAEENLARNQVLVDTIRIVSTSLLGMTVGCAQCHDHRYDPIPQTDYYRLRAVFEPAYDWKHWRVPAARRVSLYTDADREQAKRIEAQAVEIDQQRAAREREYIGRTFEKELAKLPEELRDSVRAAFTAEPEKRTDAQKALLKAHPSVNVSAGSLYLYDKLAADDLKKMADDAAKVRSQKPVEDFIRAMTEEPGRVPATFVFARGDHEQPKQEVSPGDLTVLTSASEHNSGAIAANDPALPTTGRRLAYARHLTDGTHPLTARVLVNRVWMNHFGRGIVATPGDFGYLGDRPTHPQLLDWLADEFVQHGWSLKHLHRVIMTSSTYRQSSHRGDRGEQIDPDDRLLWHMPLRRLEAEAVRDAILAVSGKLNLKAFGEPVPVMEDGVGQIVIGKENKDGEGKPGQAIPLEGEEFRRSVYVQMRRSRRLAVLEAFDSPEMTPNCELRVTSTVAPQALMLMNSDFVVEQAGYFADRVMKEAGDDLKARVTLAWRLAYSSEPDTAQVAGAIEFVNRQVEQARAAAHAARTTDASAGRSQTPDPMREAMTTFCHALLSSNRFLYID